MKTKNLLLTFAILFIALISGCASDDFQETIGICPIVESTSPVANALAVPVDKVITITFNKEVDPATINQTSITLTGAGAVAGTVTYSGRTATFTPSSPLAENTTYTGRVKTLVKDLMGNALQEDYVWAFTTGLILRPIVTSTDPINNAINVELNKIITATFSMAMNPTTLNATSFTVKQGLNPVAGAIAYTGFMASFTPTNPLLANTTYTVTITTEAKNTLGTAMAANYVWTFKTGVNPTVTATDPVNNATDVNLLKTVTADFSIVMDPSTINTTSFTLRQGTTSILGTVSYSGLTASFDPTAALESGKVYTATITTNAKSTIGIPLATNYVWSFTTTVTPQIIVLPPTINLGTAAMFGAFGGNAGITNQGLNTVINNGSIGTTAASTLITGFHDATAIYTETPLNVGNVTGRIYTAPPAPGTATSFAVASQGLLDANAAYLSISPASKPGGTDPGAGELGGLTLAPGVYKSASGTFKISNGNLTLDAQGNPNATWIFQTAAGLTVGIAGPTGAKSVIMKNGALPKNVFWYVGTAATINGAGGGTMVGTIISMSGVTLSTAGNAAQTVLNGRAISLVASVTMVNTTINVPSN
jgi:tetrahydromethanopterin S-methyltransferase subunit B